MSIRHLGILLAIGVFPIPVCADLWTVGYSPWWTTENDAAYLAGEFPGQAQLLNEVVYFGEFRFQADGTVIYQDGANPVSIIVSNGMGGYVLNNHWAVNHMTAVVNRIETVSPDTRITFTIGGWGNSQNFDVVGNDPTARANAANQIRWIMDLASFDGVDFDWEQGHPDDPDVDATAYTYLTAGTRAVLGAGEHVTVAIQPFLQSVGNAIEGNVDVIRVITYDSPGAGGDLNHTSLIGAQTIILSWISAGVAAEKLGIGTAMYGRFLGDPWNQPTETYRSLDADYFGAEGVWLPNDVTEYQNYGFDSVGSILAKGLWANRQGLHTIFSWELSGEETRARRDITFR